MAHAYWEPSWDSAAIGDEIAVVGDEARHAVKVARLRVGERILLLNGRGARVEAEVVEASPEVFRARALSDSIFDAAQEPRLVLVQALAKGGRDEMALQAAVELGVDAVIPWQAQRSVSRWVGEKATKNRQRWETIAREASKQSLRSWIPEVADVVTSKQLVGAFPPGKVLVLDPEGDTRLGDLDLSEIAQWEALTLVIGPEGGVADPEISAFVAAGAETVRLGSSVLRTSTAGPAAIAALLTRLARW